MMPELSNPFTNPLDRKGVARYVIVLDRFDDDDWGGDQVAGGHDGSAEAGMMQVAAELQEAMTNHGTPAGFFQVIERRRVSYGESVNHQNDADAIARSLGIERRLESDEND